MGDAVLPNFEAQCQAMLAARPKAISSIMGLFDPSFVSEMKARSILWIATATTVAEACAAEAAGADAIIAQGMEAGGHRGSFRAEDVEGSLEQGTSEAVKLSCVHFTVRSRSTCARPAT